MPRRSQRACRPIRRPPRSAGRQPASARAPSDAPPPRPGRVATPRRSQGDSPPGVGTNPYWDVTAGPASVARERKAHLEATAGVLVEARVRTSVRLDDAPSDRQAVAAALAVFRAAGQHCRGRRVKQPRQVLLQNAFAAVGHGEADLAGGATVGAHGDCAQGQRMPDLIEQEVAITRPNSSGSTPTCRIGASAPPFGTRHGVRAG